MSLRSVGPKGRPLFLALFILGSAREGVGQPLQIGIIDLYGLHRVSGAQIRQAMTFKEGDTISLAGARPKSLADSEVRLSRLPGVTRARASIVCCDQGRAIVFVGIEERGAATLRFRSAPRGTVRLASDVVQAGDDASEALIPALRAGDAAEDDSQGHALNHAPAMRAAQERFLTYADRDLPQLRRVLRDSSDAKQRALAAQVLGYASDKQAVVDDLVYAMTDPFDEVRNNAMRALLVFGQASPSAVRPATRVPEQPFIALLDSLVWTDRNKASGALDVLSQAREPQLLARLRTQAMTPLVEMARWKSEGHAMAAFMILGRIAGYSDMAAEAAWRRGEREPVIAAALRPDQTAPPLKVHLESQIGLLSAETDTRPAWSIDVDPDGRTKATSSRFGDTVLTPSAARVSRMRAAIQLSRFLELQERYAMIPEDTPLCILTVQLGDQKAVAATWAVRHIGTAEEAARVSRLIHVVKAEAGVKGWPDSCR